MNIFYKLHSGACNGNADGGRFILPKRNVFNLHNSNSTDPAEVAGRRNDDCSGYKDDGDGDGDDNPNSDGVDSDDCGCGGGTTVSAIRPPSVSDGVVVMQTASSDFPGPKFYLNGCVYPTKRTTFKYTCANCEHVFQTQMIQIRSGDEGESLVQTCEKCGMKKINN